MPTILSWIIGIITVFWILSIIDAFKSRKEDRTVWIIATIFLYILGTLLYIFIAMDKDSFFWSSLKKQLMSMRSVFKNFSLFSLTLFLDVLFYLSAGVCGFLFFLAIKAESAKLGSLDLESIKAAITSSVVNESVTGKMSSAVDVMRSFYINFIIYLVIFLLAAIILYSIFNAIIWSSISREKLSKDFFLKFFLLVLMLSIILSLVIAAFAFFTGEYLLTLIPYVLLIFFYFAYIAFFFFSKNQKVFDSMARMIVKGTAKFHMLVLPITFLSIIYLLIFAFYYYISKLNIPIITVSLYAVALISFLSFARLFLYEAYDDATKGLV